MPGFPASYLVFVQSESTFGLLEARLDPPAAARDANQLLERRALRGEHHVVGELSRVFQAATHEQQVLEAPLFFGNLQPEQWQERPVVEARTFGSVSRRETFPLTRSRLLREHVSPDLPRSTICVRPQRLAPLHSQHEGPSTLLEEHSSSPLTAVNGVSGHPCSGDLCLKSALQHLSGKLGLCRELDVLWNASLCPTLGVVRPALGQVQSPVNESRPFLRGIAEEHADLAVLLLARRTRVLWLNPNRLGPLLQEAGLVADEHRSLVCEVLDHVLAHKSSRTRSVSHSAWLSSLCIPSGVLSPTASAICQPFLRSTEAASAFR